VYTRTGDQQRSGLVSANVRPEGLFHALTICARHSGYALQKYRPGRTDLILVGGIAQLKPALWLMMSYRLVIREVEGAEVLTSYTRWLESVQLKEGENQEVYVAFNPRFERIWLEARKRLPDYMEQKPANTGLRSQYALRLYGWAKKYVEAGTVSISLEDLRKLLGLESIKDVDGNVIKQPPLPIWANFRQRALNVAIAEINKKTDLGIKLKSIEQSKHRRVVALAFAIKAQAVPKRRPEP
jgi:plasmid replication initiation protein